MIPILLRAGGRYHLKHPLQLGLALLGVTLGVAVVVAVDAATGSARRAFSLSAEAVGGRATHEITGGPAGIADSVYVRVRSSLPDGVLIAPVVDRYVRLPAYGNRVVRLLGVDLFAEAPFRTFSGGVERAFDAGLLLTRRALLVSSPTAAALGVAVGDSLSVAFGTTSSTAEIAGLLDPHDDLARRALADVVIADISTAQELTGSIGSIDRIEVRVDAGREAELSAFAAALPQDLRLIAAGIRAGATARLTRAFDTNLTALALIALVFGMFLIYNSVAFSVVQRRPLFGLLRAQGVTARELFTQILGEAAVLGSIAAVLGIVAGSVLGAQLLRLVSRTINDLYFAVSVSAVAIDALTVGKAVLLGVCGTVLAALPPALEALRAPPRATLARAVLERRTLRRASRFALLGAASGLVSAVLLLIPSRSITLGFGALFVLVLATALVTPAATILVMRVLRPAAAAFGAVGRMSTRGVTASLSRTAPAIAALAVAIAVGIAVTVMITSFRAGVVRWLEQSLQADLYIAAPDVGANRTGVTLDPRLARDVMSVEGIAGVSTYRQMSLLLGADLVRMFAFDPFDPHRGAFELLDAAPEDAWGSFDRGGVLVSEPLAYQRGIAAGDSITLPTDRGNARFVVAGVYRDYASEHGIIFMPRHAYEAWWRDRALTSLAVFTRDDAAVDSVLERIRRLPAAAGTIVRQTRALRAATLQVFDRTFLITGVLRLLALIVAFVGITGALMALQLERTREIGVLRATGFTPLQVWALVTSQTTLMGLAAAALAVPLGLALSWAMVNVINRRSFGWSFDMMFGPAPFVQAVAVGVGAAVLAGIYPALRMARLRPAQALRDE